MKRFPIVLLCLAIGGLLLISCEGATTNFFPDGDSNQPGDEDGEISDGDETPDGDDNTPDGDDDSPDGDEPPDGDETPDGDGSPDGDDSPDGDETPDGDKIPDGDDAPDGDEDWSLDPVPCDHDDNLDHPRLVPDPAEIDFGSVPMGDHARIEVLLCNAGGTGLQISSLEFTRETSREINKMHADTPITVAPGTAARMYVEYRPTDEEVDEGAVIVGSNDPENDELSIPILPTIPKVSVLNAVPDPMAFPGGEAGTTLRRTLELRNGGNVPLSVFSMEMQAGNRSPFTVDAVRTSPEGDPVEGPWSLAPDERIIVDITYLIAVNTGVETDDLKIQWFSLEQNRSKTVRITGGGVSSCAIVDAGPDQEAHTGQTVHLDGSASYDINGTIQAYRWEWEIRPQGSAAAVLNSSGTDITGQWVQDPLAKFVPLVPGSYALRLTVEDEDEDCTAVNQDFLSVEVDDDIRLVLTWSQPGNDHDLHLIQPEGSFSRECGSNPTDCCWSNCDTKNGTDMICPPRGCPGPQNAPDWNQPDERRDDPMILEDDIQGTGPEILVMNGGMPGDYTVSVENYSGSSSGNTITVRVYLRGELSRTFTHDSYASNHHWNVCTLRIPEGSGAVEVIELGDVLSSSPGRGVEKKKPGR